MRKYLYYKEERDGIIHKGANDEAIKVFRSEMIFQSVDPKYYIYS